MASPLARTVGVALRTRLSSSCMCATALVALASSAHDAAAQIPTPEIQNVRFEGNETFPADSLAAAIVTQETECRSKVLVVPFCVLGVDFALRREDVGPGLAEYLKRIAADL